MTSACGRLSAQVRAASAKGVILGLSPGTLEQALGSFNVDWRSWGTSTMTSGALLDEIVPQPYRDNYPAFAEVFNDTLQSLYPESNNDSDPFVSTQGIGLRVDGSGSPTPWTDLDAMLEDCATPRPGIAASGLSSSLWYSHGALELYPSELRAYWGSGGSQM